MTETDNTTWEAGIIGLQNEWRVREAPFTRDSLILPNTDIDLKKLAQHPCPAPASNFEHLGRKHFPSRMYDVHQEIYQANEMQSALCLLTAQLVPVFRRRDPDPAFLDLWNRIWNEQAKHLIERLPPRWLISAIQTFGDYGETEPERILGCEAVQFFGMMKIYEGERKYSGLPSWKIFSFGNKNYGPMPLRMEPFSLEDGDLDRYLVVRLGQQAQSCNDKPVSWLVMHLLNELNTDANNIFRRLSKIRKRFR
ncbi:hypothetical protein [Halocynthiibacter sp.]|uniref:hypothetical protein n=1 Tax=Halocynthiibacter sp. TaxID=1979210 RepID=UPI003C60BA35